MIKNTKRPNRFAQVKAISDIVLYDAYEGKDLINANVVRPIDRFLEEYDTPSSNR